MTYRAPLIPETYHDSVMIWGNQSPWSKLGCRLKHDVCFQPDEVVRDGIGNILSMPTLERKPCFGRPEAVFRHGKRTRKIELPNGSIVDSKNHQCGSCPKGVHKACILTAYERVTSDPSMLTTFLAWRQDCDTYYNGSFICTGDASLSWGKFKRAIAQRGPFESSNDTAVAELELQKRAAQKEKWKRQKRSQRKRARETAREAQQLPSAQFVLNFTEERDRRFEALLKVLGQSGQPPSRAKVLANNRLATATITANAWAVRELLHTSGQDASPGKIASLMAKHQLNSGVPAPTLKARMKNDLRRADECERDGLWKPFDPDLDLDGYAFPDDDAADALNNSVNEIERILWEIDPVNLFPDCL